MSLRWEWRTFGDRLGDLIAVRFENVVESDEIYLLSAEGRDAVKVRSGLMDIKHLEQVDDHGLELWRPVMKSPLPISVSDARAVLTALAVDAPLTRSSYDVDAFVGVSATATAVPVHKTRRHFTFGGCMAEMTDLRAADRLTSTIAIESEHPARVIAAVRDLGLESRPNTSVPRGLKAFLELA